jgi:anti-anti-sigma factor
MSSETAPVIALEGRVDPGTVIALHRHLSWRLESGRSHFVIELAGVISIGTQTLNLLCGAFRQLSRRGATIAIAGVDPCLRRVLEIYAIDYVELPPTLDPAAGGLGEWLDRRVAVPFAGGGDADRSQIRPLRLRRHGRVPDRAPAVGAPDLLIRIARDTPLRVPHPAVNPAGAVRDATWLARLARGTLLAGRAMLIYGEGERMCMTGDELFSGFSMRHDRRLLREGATPDGPPPKVNALRGIMSVFLGGHGECRHPRARRQERARSVAAGDP